MCAIATYVFFDLETTGLPCYENNKTKITELSFVAVKKEHLLTSKSKVPRVQNKVTLCFNPQKMVDFEASKKTGLSNELLEYEAPFDSNTCCLLNGFLEALTNPICLVAYNGNKFDFPILKNRLEKLNAKFPEDVMCADSYFCFYDLTVNNKLLGSPYTTDNALDFSNEQISDYDDDNSLDMKVVNETTPERKNYNGDRRPEVSKARRRFPWSEGAKPVESFQLTEVYKRLLHSEPKMSHNAEGDCMLMLECAMFLGKRFVQWTEQNCEKFSSIKPMTIGVPLGQ